MTLPNFGIPDLPAAVNSIADGMDQNATMLQNTALQVANPIITGLTTNEQQLGKIAASLNRSVAARSTAVQKAINPVLATLQGAVATGVANSGQALSSAGIQAAGATSQSACVVWVSDRLHAYVITCGNERINSQDFHELSGSSWNTRDKAVLEAKTLGYTEWQGSAAQAATAATSPALHPYVPSGVQPVIPVVSNPVPDVSPTVPVVAPTSTPIGNPPTLTVSPFTVIQNHCNLGNDPTECYNDSWGRPPDGNGDIAWWVKSGTAAPINFSWMPDEPGWQRLWYTAKNRPLTYTDTHGIPPAGYSLVYNSPPYKSCLCGATPTPINAPTTPTPIGTPPTPPPTPPTPPPESPTHPPVPVSPKCTLPSSTNPASARIGSVEWCKNLDVLTAYLKKIGSDIKTMIANFSSVMDLQAKDTDSVLSSLTFGLTDKATVKNILELIPNEQIKSSLGGLWLCINTTVNSLNVCDVELTLSIAIIRSLLGMLKHVRAGWDAFVWATLDFVMTLPELERYLDYMAKHACPTELPAVPDALACWLRNSISEDQFRCWMLLNGADPNVWAPVISAAREKFTPEEMIQYLRRKEIPDAQVPDYLRQLGWLDPKEREGKVFLYDELPTIQDHLHFLQRNVFDAQYVKDFELMEGFDTRFWPAFGKDLHSLGMLQKYAELHYAAHWINPAPGQLLEMVYRLRPGKAGVINPFSITDYERVLVEQDVAPYFRKRFAEIAFKVPALSYAREQYFQYLWTDQELQSYHEDLGYSPTDAKRFLDIDRIVRARRRASGGHGWTPTAIAKAYSSGQMSKADGTQYMKDQGYSAVEADILFDRADSDLKYTVFTRARSRVMSGTVTQVRNALRVGVVDTAGASKILQNIGWQKSFADGLAQLESSAANVDRIKKAVLRVRSALHNGEIDATYVGVALTQLGIVPQAIQDYLTAWQVEMTPNRKRRTASQVINDVAEGMLTNIEAMARLHNLGYNQADSVLYLADAQRKILARQSKMQSQQAKLLHNQANELIKMQKDARKQAADLRGRLNRLASPAKLVKWAKSGLINQGTFKARLAALGVDKVDIDRLWNEAENAKNAQVDQDQTITPNEPGVSGGTIPTV